MHSNKKNKNRPSSIRNAAHGRLLKEKPNNAPEGIYANSLFLHVAAAHIGHPIRILTTEGAIYEGFMKTFSKDFEIAVEMAHKINPDDPDIIDIKNMPETCIFSTKNIVQISALDLDLDYAAKAGTGFTDSAISKFNGEVAAEKELQPWMAPSCNGEEFELEDTSCENGWNVNEMFKANELKYGVQSTYDDTLVGYTTQIATDTKDFKEDEARATRIAMEIEGSSQSKQRSALENGEDEEEMFAAVHRPVSGTTSGGADSKQEGESSNKYVVPPKRSGGNGQGSGNSGSQGRSGRTTFANSPPRPIPVPQGGVPTMPIMQIKTSYGMHRGGGITQHQRYPSATVPPRGDRDNRLNGQMGEGHGKHSRMGPPIQGGRGGGRNGQRQFNSEHQLNTQMRYHHPQQQQQPQQQQHHFPMTRDMSNRSPPNKAGSSHGQPQLFPVQIVPRPMPGSISQQHQQHKLRLPPPSAPHHYPSSGNGNNAAPPLSQQPRKNSTNPTLSRPSKDQIEELRKFGTEFTLAVNNGNGKEGTGIDSGALKSPPQAPRVPPSNLPLQQQQLQHHHPPPQHHQPPPPQQPMEQRVPSVPMTQPPPPLPLQQQQQISHPVTTCPSPTCPKPQFLPQSRQSSPPSIQQSSPPMLQNQQVFHIQQQQAAILQQIAQQQAAQQQHAVQQQMNNQQMSQQQMQQQHQQQQTHCRTSPTLPQQLHLSPSSSQSSTPSPSMGVPPMDQPLGQGDGDDAVEGVVNKLKTSKLNPNAKEFVFNPSAKSFTPHHAPSTPSESRPHTPQTPQPPPPTQQNYSMHPGQAVGSVTGGTMMMTYMMPTFVPAVPGRPQPARLPKVVRAEYHTGQPLLQPAVAQPGIPHGAQYMQNYPHAAHLAAAGVTPSYSVPMIRMLPQQGGMALVPSSINYHHEGGGGVYVNHSASPSMVAAAQIHHQAPPSTAPSPSHTPQVPSQPHTPNGGGGGSGGYGQQTLAASHPPYPPIMCPIIQPPHHTHPHHMINAGAPQHAMQSAYLSHPQAGQHGQHIQLLLPHGGN